MPYLQTKQLKTVQHTRDVIIVRGFYSIAVPNRRSVYLSYGHVTMSFDPAGYQVFVRRLLFVSNI